MKIPKSKVLRAAGQALAHSLKTLPFELLGYFVVPFLYRYRQVPLSIMKTKHPWLLPWVNPEDWTSGWRAHPPEYETIPKDLSERFQGFWGWYRYHAMRNRASGLRNYAWHNVPMRSGEIRYLTPKEVESYQDWWIFLNEQPIAGDRFWHLTQMGKYVGFKYIRYFTFMDDLRYWEVKLGYRIGPYDADGYNAESNRWKYGTTPTFQILKFGTAGSDYD